MLREGLLLRPPPNELPLLREGLTEREGVEMLREGVETLREGLTERDGADTDGRCVVPVDGRVVVVVVVLREGAETDGRCVVPVDGRVVVVVVLLPVVPPKRRPMVRGDELIRPLVPTLGAVVRVLLSRMPWLSPERPKRPLPLLLAVLPPLLRLPKPPRLVPFTLSLLRLRLPKVRLLLLFEGSFPPRP